MATKSPGDEGFTLVEVLLATVILGVAGIVFVTGVGAAVKVSGYHRNESTIQTILRDQSEALASGVALCPSAGGTLLTNTYVAPVNPPYTVNVTYATPAGGSLLAANACPASTTWTVATIKAWPNSNPTAFGLMNIVLRTP